MRLQEFAERLGVSRDTIRRAERRGVLPAAQRDWAGHRRYTEADVEQARKGLLGGAGITPAGGAGGAR